MKDLQQRFKVWIDRGSRSVYFFIALFLHVVIFLMIASWVIFHAPPPEKEDFGKVFVPPGAPPPPPPASTPTTVSVSPTVMPLTPTAITSTATMPTFNVTMPVLTTTTTTQHVNAPHVTPPSTSMTSARLTSIRSTVSSWRDAANIREANGDVHNLVAKFPVCIAKYSGGDWNTNNFADKPDEPDTITSGALPNLSNKIAEWSHNSLVAQPPRIIQVDSPDLITNPPPYIFFTGHTNFQLTDAEVANLQKYIQIGGAIWGDSAFAGSGSRFDVAFHREMKRVLPDDDKNFEPLPMDHPIFSKSWFPMKAIPTGINFHKDPIEVINVDGKLAVLYTPNDYGDMMTMFLAPGSDEDSAKMTGGVYYTPEQPLHTRSVDWIGGAQFYYRNYEPGPVMTADKLGMNIIAHLLIRFDDKLQMAP